MTFKIITSFLSVNIGLESISLL